MPPKRKGKAAAATPAKKVKQAEETPEPGTLKDKIAKLKEADKGKVKKFKPDPEFPFGGADVFQDYDAMLNQTNIGKNNNKFYIIQVIKHGPHFYAWNRWGRVGESGQNKLDGPFNNDQPAVKNFEKKFKDKTKNNWANRDSFQAVPGKYTLLEMAGEEDDDDDEEMLPAAVAAPKAASGPTKTSACKLDKTTQGLIKLIFDNDMFKETLQQFDIDVKKMPLGKLSKTQIAKGFEVLEELELAIEQGKRQKLNDLTSKFYTIIPHSFGRTVPPPITTIEGIQKKYDMLAVLGDIEIAQAMQKAVAKDGGDGGESLHPLDINYKQLDCELELLDSKCKEYKIVEKNYESTKGGWSRFKKLQNVWKVNRLSEGERFAVNDKIDHRKLLWHGTNVAVVSAILKSGLRIMPHSGGRVGKGIYFASENEKSAGYVGAAQNKVVMFLNEVALGNIHRITRDNSSLKKAPSGFDSVLACGQREPDEKLDVSLKIDGKDIIVPQGKPVAKPEYTNSSFYNSEYLVYREDQARIRYLLLFEY